MYCFRYLILTFSFLWISFPLLAQDAIPAPVAAELKVLVPSAYPYYFTLDNQQRPEGFAIDVFDEIAARAGINFKYQPEIDLATLEQAIIRDAGDILLNIGDVSQLQDSMDVLSVVHIPVSVFVRDNGSDFDSIGDLSKHKVALVSGQLISRHMRILNQLPDVQIVQFNLIEVAFYALMSGKVDALIYLDPAVWNVAVNLQLSDRVKTLSPPLIEIDYTIGVSKQNPQLTQQLVVALRSLIISEKYHEIYTRWFNHDMPFWNTRTVFWSMSALIVLIVIIFQWMRSRELVQVNESLQQQIDDATLQLSENNAYLMDLTVTDTLTGINNRRAFENSLSELIIRSSRYEEIFSMLIFDIDDFKKLNDQYGHDMGDRVLVELVDRIKSIVRDVDTLCRWGGEEFTVLMPQTRQAGALKMAERCRSIIADSLFDEVGRVTISLGVTCFRPSDNERELFKRADDALYQAKSQGKNCVVWNGEVC